jgi:hypothetical protein
VTEEQYPDPPVDAIQRLAHALLPLASLGDVTARLVTARREERSERDREEAARQRRLLAANRAVAAATYTPALHDEWLQRATLTDLGAAWRAGHLYADRDPQAARAAHRVEDRLREMHPPAMWHYTRRRADGLSPAAAMAEAARIMAFVHPNPYGPGPDRVGMLTNTADPATVADHANAEAYTRGLNPRWLTQASLFDLGQAWQAAHRHITADPRAATAAHEIEKQLRQLHPPAMRHYDGLRTGGYSAEGAMLLTAPLMATIDPTARPGPPAPVRRALPETSPQPADDAPDQREKADRGRETTGPAETSLGEGADATEVAGLRDQMFPMPVEHDLTSEPSPAAPAKQVPVPTRAPTPARR